MTASRVKNKSSGLFLLLAVPWKENEIWIFVLTCEWVNDDYIPLKPGRNVIMTEDGLIKACSPTERNRATSELKISPRSVSLSRDEIAAPTCDRRRAALWRHCEMWPWFALITHPTPPSPPWLMYATLSESRSFQTLSLKAFRCLGVAPIDMRALSFISGCDWLGSAATAVHLLSFAGFLHVM